MKSFDQALARGGRRTTQKKEIESSRYDNFFRHSHKEELDVIAKDILLNIRRPEDLVERLKVYDAETANEVIRLFVLKSIEIKDHLPYPSDDNVTHVLSIIKKAIEILDAQGVINARQLFLQCFYLNHASQEKMDAIIFLQWVPSYGDLTEENNDFFKNLTEEILPNIVHELFDAQEYFILMRYAKSLQLQENQIAECIKGLKDEGKNEQIFSLIVNQNLDTYDSWKNFIQRDFLPSFTDEEYQLLFQRLSKHFVSLMPEYLIKEEVIMRWSNLEPSFVRDVIQMDAISSHCVIYLAKQLPEFQNCIDSPHFTVERIKLIVDSGLESVKSLVSESSLGEVTSVVLQFPWLLKSPVEWSAEPIGLSKERSVSLSRSLVNVPPDQRENFEKRFLQNGVTKPQMEHWLGRHAFRVPAGWNPRLVGEMMFSRLTSGVSTDVHDASYFFTAFECPAEIQGDERKQYNSSAQNWLKNYISTPAERLVYAWQNRQAALADKCADNPTAIFLWGQANSLRRLLDSSEASLNISPEKKPTVFAFLVEIVRRTSPEEALRIFEKIQKAHKTESAFRPVRIDLGNGYTGEIFRKDDPRGTTIGADTGCCMSVGGASEACIVAGYTDPRYGFFGLYKEGSLIAQSLLYTNDQKPDVLVCDNIEASKGRDIDDILSMYDRFFSLYIKQTGGVFQKVYIGEGYSSVGLDKLQKVQSDKMSPTPLPIYTDADEGQRVLIDVTLQREVDGKTPNTQNIDWLDVRPVVSFTDKPETISFDEDEDEE